MSKIILGIDPGKINMGYGVVKCYRTTKKVDKHQVLAYGMLKHTLKDLKPVNLKDSILKFSNEVDTIITKHNIDIISIERFTSRGLLGSLSEYICIMQGAIAMLPQVSHLTLVMPATWKNAFNKFSSLKEFYKLAKQYQIQSHEVDAILIAIYRHQTFEKFSSFKFQQRFLHKLVQLSL